MKNAFILDFLHDNYDRIFNIRQLNSTLSILPGESLLILSLILLH